MASASRLICCTGLDCSSEANSSTSRCLSSREISSRFRAVSASACSSCRAFLVGRFTHVKFGLGRIERRIFVGEIDGFVFVGPVGPFVFDGRGFLLRRRGNGGRLCDSGASPAFGYVLHIFGLADMFLGNRDVGFLGSHLQGFYSLLCPALFRQPTKVLLFCKKFQDGAANRPKVFIFPSFAADRPRRCKYSRRPGLRHVFFITFAPA